MTCFLDFAADLVHNINAVWPDEVFPHNDILCALCTSHLALILDRQPLPEDYTDVKAYFNRTLCNFTKNVVIDRSLQSGVTVVLRIFYGALLKHRSRTNIVVFGEEKGVMNRFVEYLRNLLGVRNETLLENFMFMGRQARPMPRDCDVVLVLDRSIRPTRAWKQHVLEAPVPVVLTTTNFDVALCNAGKIVPNTVAV